MLGISKMMLDGHRDQCTQGPQPHSIKNKVSFLMWCISQGITASTLNIVPLKQSKQHTKKD